MIDPKIVGRLRRLSDTALVDATADALSDIRKEDKLTWLEVGKIVGRSDDMAAKYADGTAVMPFTCFHRAEIAWGSRFSGPVRIILDGAAADGCGHRTLNSLLRAATEISEALQDNTLCDEDIREARAELARARDDIDGLLARLGPKVGAA